MGEHTWQPFELPNRIVVTGHYGTGKTNLVMNLASDLAESGREVVVIDLDVVNPYFRSSEFRDSLQDVGIKLIAPNFAGTTLDTPSLSGAIDGVFGLNSTAIFDVGGDDVGATALGRYREHFRQGTYVSLYVTNQNRNMTRTVDESVEIAREIESACGVALTHIVANSHLQHLTTSETVAQSAAFALEVGSELGLPVLCATVPSTVWDVSNNDSHIVPTEVDLYPVQIFVKPPWEQAPI